MAATPTGVLHTQEKDREEMEENTEGSEKRKRWNKEKR